MIKVQSFEGIVESYTESISPRDRLDNRVNNFIEDRIERFGYRVIDIKFSLATDGNNTGMAMVIYETR